jgi:hypothetical protein
MLVARVFVRRQQLTFEVTNTTDQEGEFAFDNISEAAYVLAFVGPGFSTYHFTGNCLFDVSQKASNLFSQNSHPAGADLIDAGAFSIEARTIEFVISSSK